LATLDTSAMLNLFLDGTFQTLPLNLHLGSNEMLRLLQEKRIEFGAS
jgi:hypothetical protein